MSLENWGKIRPMLDRDDRSGDELFFEPKGAFYPPEFAIKHIRVPENPPHLLGLHGPARGGTTAFLFTLASHPDVQKTHFQGVKKLLRHGTEYGDMVLEEGNQLEVFKDTTGPERDEELFDPVDFIIAAGMPSDKLTWIFSLKDPVKSFRSLRNFTPNITPEYYARMQNHTIGLYLAYMREGLNVLPFVFDLLEKGEEKVFGRLLEKTGLGLEANFSLDFDQYAIQAKTDWGEAKKPEYYQEVITPTLSKGRYRYVSGTVDKGVKHNSDELKQVEQLCRKPFETFYNMTKKELGFW